MNYAEPRSHAMRHYLQTLVTTVGSEINFGNPWGAYPKPKDFFEKITKWREALTDDVSFLQLQNDALEELQKKMDDLIAVRSVKYPNMNFSPIEVNDLYSLLRNAHQTFGGNEQDTLPMDADIPRPFSGEDFLRSIEANAELMNTSDYVETMLMRVRTLLSDAKLKPVICPETKITLDEWMNRYICPSDCTDGSITIIDLSLVPAELTHIIVAVMARMTLESLQRYRKMNAGQTLPTTLIMEEAHTFIKRFDADSESGNASEMCAKVFEKIAREGRKFGLGLILSSQRPSDRSATVFCFTEFPMTEIRNL